jgi:hypothetical protein
MPRQASHSQRLTQRLAVQTKIQNGSRTFVWDSELKGFGLKIYPSGSKSWVVKISGREKIIGSIFEVNESEARLLASRMKSEYRAGLDPIEEQKRKAIERKRARGLQKYSLHTCATLFIRSEKSLPNANDKHRKDTFRLLEKYVLNHKSIIHKPITEFGWADLTLILDNASHLSGSRRNAILLAITQMWDFLTIDPEISAAFGRLPPLDTRGLRSRTTIREDRLEPQQLHSIFSSADDLNNVFQSAFIKFAILTTRRKDTVRLAKWDEFDLNHNKQAVWNIPAERNRKGRGNQAGRAEKIPLTNRMVDILFKLPRDGEFVFGGRKPIDAGDKLLKKIKSLTGIWQDERGLSWTYHGFRRSLASSDFGFEKRDIIDAIQGRVEKGSARSYFQGDYLDAKLEVLMLWDKMLFNPEFELRNQMVRHRGQTRTGQPTISPAFEIAVLTLYEDLILRGLSSTEALIELTNIYNLDRKTYEGHITRARKLIKNPNFPLKKISIDEATMVIKAGNRAKPICFKLS